MSAGSGRSCATGESIVTRGLQAGYWIEICARGQLAGAALQVILQLLVCRVTASLPNGSRTPPLGWHGRIITMIGRENLNRSHGSTRKSFAILRVTSASS